MKQVAVIVTLAVAAVLGCQAAPHATVIETPQETSLSTSVLSDKFASRLLFLGAIERVLFSDPEYMSKQEKAVKKFQEGTMDRETAGKIILDDIPAHAYKNIFLPLLDKYGNKQNNNSLEQEWNELLTEVHQKVAKPFVETMLSSYALKNEVYGSLGPGILNNAASIFKRSFASFTSGKCNAYASIRKLVKQIIDEAINFVDCSNTDLLESMVNKSMVAIEPQQPDDGEDCDLDVMPVNQLRALVKKSSRHVCFMSTSGLAISDALTEVEPKLFQYYMKYFPETVELYESYYKLALYFKSWFGYDLDTVEKIYSFISTHM